ncbi:MAG: carboxypeptidase regulatory-like domain-containing protein [Gemmatirosa sp.]
MRPLRSVVAPAAALALLLPAAVHAQAVAGEVVDGTAGTPLPNAVVVLLDTLRARHAAALTDSAGRFALVAPTAGTYVVRAERVGSTSATSAPLTLALGDTVRVRLALGAAARLSAIRVTARERCRIRPSEDETAARLWDEARKALAGTALGESREALDVRLGRFTRVVASDRKTVKNETWTLANAEVQQFRSMDAADLGERGFVEPAMSAAGTDSVVYYAPDAEVLLSDAFLASHCLRAVSPPATRAGQLGLAIEPVPRRGEKRADVRGTLWIDTASFELRDFEFEYTDLPALVPEGRAGGRVGFGRLANGRWFVSRWVISMPSAETVTYLRHVTPSLHAPAARDARETAVVVGLTEVGGRAIVPGAPRGALDATVLSGTLVDSSSGGQPIDQGRVVILGTPYQALVNGTGEFYLEVPRAGDFLIRVEVPRASSLGLAWTQLLSLQPGREVRLEAAIPSTATLRRIHCGVAADTAAPLLAGVVRAWRAERRGDTPELREVADAAIEIEWRLASWPADWKERRTVRSDARGRYRVCELPAGADVVVRARRGSTGSEPWTGRADTGAAITADLMLVPAASLGKR